MPQVLSLARCPNCGAPVNVPQGTFHVICVYCNHSLTVTRPQGAPASLASESSAVADVERVKSLIIDGRRDEAIRHYMEVAKIPEGEAAAAVDALVLESHATLTRHLPLTTGGIFLQLAILGGLVGFGALCVFLVPYASFFKIVLAAPIALFFLGLVAFLRHLSATWTDRFGAEGEAKVVRCGVLRQLDPNAYLAICHFEVTPADGSPSFHDQETVFVGSETLQKLAPGNVIGVRFDGARKHVYMRTPVVVLATRA